MTLEHRSKAKSKEKSMMDCSQYLLFLARSVFRSSLYFHSQSIELISISSLHFPQSPKMLSLIQAVGVSLLMGTGKYVVP